MSSTSVWKQVATLLLERQATSPASAISAAEIRAELGLGNSINVELNRLVKRLAVRRLRRSGRSCGPERYWLTERGANDLRASEDGARPWHPGTILSTDHADYKIEGRLRPSASPSSQRVDVFLASVQAMKHTSLHPTLQANARVVVKGLAQHMIERVKSRGAKEARAIFEDLKKLFVSEAITVQSARPMAGVARTFDWGFEALGLSAGPTVMVPFIVQEHIDGRDLRASLKHDTDQFKGFESTDEWFAFAEQLLENVKQAQSVGPFVRYISPETVVMPKAARRLEPCPVLTDLLEAVFYSVPATRPEAPAGTGGEDATAILDAFVAPEWRKTGRREGSRSADVFSVGAVLYYSLTGEAPRFFQNDADELKQAVSARLTGTLASDNHGIVDIVSRCLRPTLEADELEQQRVADIHTVLEDVRTFRGVKHSMVDLGVTLIASGLKLSRNNDVFAALAAIELARLERTLSALEQGSITVRGHHNDFVSTLCGYLSTLGQGDEYWTVTIPDFWGPQNLGLQGRYLSMNAEIARRGARVLRVFLLCNDELRNKNVVTLVRAHLSIRQTLPDPDKFDLRYVPMDPKKRIAESRASEGYWVRGESLVRVRANYFKRGGIRDIEIARVKESKEQIEQEWLQPFLKKAKPLTKWFEETQTGNP